MLLQFLFNSTNNSNITNISVLLLLSLHEMGARAENTVSKANESSSFRGFGWHYVNFFGHFSLSVMGCSNH